MLALPTLLHFKLQPKDDTFPLFLFGEVTIIFPPAWELYFFYSRHVVVVNFVKFLLHLYVVTFYPNSALKHGAELIISSCHLPTTTLAFWLQNHFTFPKMGKFVQNPIPERIRKKSEKNPALPHEDSIMNNWKFCTSLPSCLAQWFSFGNIAHPSIALYPTLISSLSQMHRWEKTPSIPNWSCSYYSRAPKKAVVGSKWTTFLVFAPCFRLLHYFVKNASSSWTQTAHPAGSNLLSGGHKARTPKCNQETREKK